MADKAATAIAPSAEIYTKWQADNLNSPLEGIDCVDKLTTDGAGLGKMAAYLLFKDGHTFRTWLDTEGKRETCCLFVGVVPALISTFSGTSYFFFPFFPFFPPFRLAIMHIPSLLMVRQLGYTEPETLLTWSHGS